MLNSLVLHLLSSVRKKKDLFAQLNFQSLKLNIFLIYLFSEMCANVY